MTVRQSAAFTASWRREAAFPFLNDSEIQQDNNVSINRAKSIYPLLSVCLPVSVSASVLNASSEITFVQLML